MSAIATCAPAAARATAVARPSPLAAPVTRATRPVNAPVSSIRPSVRRCSLHPLGRRAGAQFGRGTSRRPPARGTPPAQPLRGCRPDVGERHRAQPALGDQRQQVAVDGRDRRVVGVPDDDRLRGEPLPGRGQQLAGASARRESSSVPFHITTVGCPRSAAIRSIRSSRAPNGGRRNGVSRTPNVLRRKSWLRPISSATSWSPQRGQVGVRPGVVAEGHLPGVDQRAQGGGVVRPRPVAAVREERQPHPAVGRERGEGGDDLAVRAVVDGERQRVAVTREAVHDARRWVGTGTGAGSAGGVTAAAGGGRGAADGRPDAPRGRPCRGPRPHPPGRPRGRGGTVGGPWRGTRRTAGRSRSGRRRTTRRTPFGALSDDSVL